MKNFIWDVIAFTILIGGIVFGIYVGGWVMFIQPIMDVCRCIDAGTVTATMIGVTVLKCVFASLVTTVIVLSGISISEIILLLKE